MPIYTHLPVLHMFHFVDRHRLHIEPTATDSLIPLLLLNLHGFWAGVQHEIDFNAAHDTWTIDANINAFWSCFLSMQVNGVGVLTSTHQVGTFIEMRQTVAELMYVMLQSDDQAELDYVQVAWDIHDPRMPAGAGGKKRSRAEMSNMLTTLSDVPPREYKSVCNVMYMYITNKI